MMFSLSTVLLTLLTLHTTNAFTNITVFQPPQNYTIPRTLYARTLLLSDSNTLLATWENYGPNNNTNPYFPIYESLDSGETWTERSRVHDQVNGWGLRYQPFLYEMPEGVGEFDAGTLLLAGSSIPDDLSVTQIDLYASKDKGYTWNFISHIARGGLALPENGLTPVWEPFLLTHASELLVYYSDQRDPAHGQKLVHQRTTDLQTWSPVETDVAYANDTFRPGMPIISPLPLGNWIYTYEFFGAEEADFAVYYRIASSPLKFAGAADHALVATDGTVPVGSPYNVWTDVGGELGTIVVSCGTLSEVFVNSQMGAEGAWTKVEAGDKVSYTRSLTVLPGDGGGKVLMAGGGVLEGENNWVSVSSVDVRPVAPGRA